MYIRRHKRIRRQLSALACKFLCSVAFAICGFALSFKNQIFDSIRLAISFNLNIHLIRLVIQFDTIDYSIRFDQLFDLIRLVIRFNSIDLISYSIQIQIGSVPFDQGITRLVTRCLNNDSA